MTYLETKSIFLLGRAMALLAFIFCDDDFNKNDFLEKYKKLEEDIDKFLLDMN